MKVAFTDNLIELYYYAKLDMCLENGRPSHLQPAIAREMLPHSTPWNIKIKQDSRKLQGVHTSGIQVCQKCAFWGKASKKKTQSME